MTTSPKLDSTTYTFPYSLIHDTIAKSVPITLTYSFKVKMWNVNISKTVRTSATRATPWRGSVNRSTYSGGHPLPAHVLANHNKKCFSLKMTTWSRSTLFTTVTFDGEYQRQQKSHNVFCDSYHYRDIKFQMCDLKNSGEGHGVQHSQWSHSMTNINLYESHTWQVFARCHRFRDIQISKLVNFKM